MTVATGATVSNPDTIVPLAAVGPEVDKTSDALDLGTIEKYKVQDCSIS